MQILLVSQEQMALSFCTVFLTWDRHSLEYKSVFGIHLTTWVATYMLNRISKLELNSPSLANIMSAKMNIMSAKMQASLGKITH